MVPRSLLLVLSMVSMAALAACGGGDKYYIPTDSQLKPFQKPEREDLVSDDEGGWDDLDLDDADAEGSDDADSGDEGSADDEKAAAKGDGAENGTGYGTGGLAKKPAAPGRSKVEIGTTSAKGSLDKNIIRRYIRRSLPRLRNCYERRLLKNPKLHGTVKSEFTIGADGKVTGAKASGFPDQKVSDCVAQTLKAIVFPKPKGGGKVNVHYPFKFTAAN